MFRLVYPLIRPTSGTETWLQRAEDSLGPPPSPRRECPSLAKLLNHQEVFVTLMKRRLPAAVIVGGIAFTLAGPGMANVVIGPATVAVGRSRRGATKGCPAAVAVEPQRENLDQPWMP